MKKPISFLLFTVLLAVAGAQAQSNKPQSTAWSFYTVKDEEFSVALPVHPSMHTVKEKREKPQKDRRRRVLGASNNDITYTIHVVENPEPRQAFDEFVKEQISNPVSDFTATGDVVLNGVTRKAFVYQDGKGMVQFIATEDRLYAFRAYGALLDDSRMKDFFSTISLKKQDKSIEVFDGPGSFYETNPLDVHKGPDLDTKVRLKAKPDPAYTAEAEMDRITGTVILRCVFTAQGTVTNIRVIKGLPGGLTEKAMEAARQIKFIPATKDGKPVSMWMQLEYNFNLYHD
ncbi:MAG TPA: TonB family protein [Pyrinomonadaceae bacterium]|nr:TonB family protein [Pyrinomonadaceae bacterium]